MKNCDPLVFGPALAMDNNIGFSCFNVKASSGMSVERQAISGVKHTFKLFCQLNTRLKRLVTFSP